MVPTLEPGDRILAESIVTVPATDLRQAIVVFENPEEKGKWLVKRVLGVPGDRISATPYAAQLLPKGDPSEGETIFTVPENHLYVVSDAVSGGRDSRQFGPVDRETVHGRVWWRYAPANRRGPVE